MNTAPFTTGTGLLNVIEGTLRRGKDFVGVSEGQEGTGKSTTTGNLTRALTKRLGYDFDVQADTIMNMDHLLDVLSDGQPYRVYVLDEAINIFHNQDWATWEAKALTKLVRQMRIMKSAWFLNVPDFEGLHPYFRDYRSRLRLYHEPHWTPTGLGNQPPRVLWKQERFDYKQQRVTTHWQDLFSLEVDSLDDDPHWKPYEQKKINNFLEQVHAIQARRNKETTPKKRRPTKASQ